MTLAARNLVCSYGPTRAVDGVDLEVADDSILAVFGPNGAGKTTLLRALSGERTPDEGVVVADGKAINGSDPEWRCRVGLVSHRTGLYMKLTVKENLLFFGVLHGLAKAALAAEEALAAVGAPELARRRAEALSHGQRQRVALARALLHDPDILFLDEPFSGLDPNGAEALETVLRERRSPGRIVVLVTHDLRRGLRLADRVVVLRRGRKTLDADRTACDAEELLGLFTDGGGGRT